MSVVGEFSGTRDEMSSQNDTVAAEDFVYNVNVRVAAICWASVKCMSCGVGSIV